MTMAKLPIPDYKARSVYDLPPDFFTDRGIKLLLLDLDNTLAKYSTNAPTPELTAWIDSLKAAGIEPFILSNNHKHRPETFGAALGVGWRNPCKKPQTKALWAVLSEKERKPGECAIVGDQVYTDVACGVAAGVLTVVVRPLDMKNPFFASRYATELPFRALARHKIK